jgi:adenine-specific DNA-methyltransferase
MNMPENNITKSFDKRLIDLLKTDSRFVDDEGELIKAAVVDRAWKIDRDLVKLLLSEPEIEKKFFDEIEGHWIFNINTFIGYISDKNFLANSYTRFRNKVGLNINEKFLRERAEVSLVWPYKDCVLEGGQTKEEEKRKEIFFNEILAQGEIDRLFDPKVLTNFKRYTPDGEQKVTKIRRGKNGTIKENLIIMGNNLLALHTLRTQFRGKIKLIYIDPPYNTGNDSFGYNDNFNHSSWLTFLRNRLEVAKELLRDDGVVFINIDDNEQSYLSVLCDEIFGRKNRYDKVAVKTSASQGGFGDVNPGLISNAENILIYAKSKDKVLYNKDKLYIKKEYDENYRFIIKNIDEKPESWEFEDLNNLVYRENNIPESYNTQTWRKLKDLWGEKWKERRYLRKAELADKYRERVFRTFNPNRPADYLKKALNESKKRKNQVVRAISSNSDKHKLCLNGEVIIFYSSIYKKIDGKLLPATRLSTFWGDISWEGISGEGGVKLRNGKKPEKLLRRIIEIASTEGDLVCDFQLGSGTACAVAHKIGRQYIGIEQLDYGKNDSVVRLQNVIGKRKEDSLIEECENYDKSGISKAVNWQGGGDFIYCELTKYNEAFMDKIQFAKTSDELLKIWKDIAKNSFLNWYVNPEMPKEAINNFMEIGRFENGLEKQKKLLAELLNKNQLYVNLSEIDDEDFKVSEDDKKLNQSFYGEAYNG